MLIQITFRTTEDARYGRMTKQRKKENGETITISFVRHK